MNTATDVLRSEHRSLGKCLNFTENVAGQIRRGEAVESGALQQAVECFRVFLDDCLLSKEEGSLFPMLERKGVSRRSGPLALMLMQHETGRSLLKRMSHAAAELEAGKTGAGNRWMIAALDFVALMRDHIKEEEAVLFMMADGFLQPREQAEIAAEFERLEAEWSTSARHKRIHAMAEEAPR